MALKPINYASHPYKIIIVGPVGAGKTQATNVLSDKKTVSTEAGTSQTMKGDKKTITVAMDYGVTVLDSGEKINIYGTPGHERFDFMWDILSENAAGMILLVNAEDNDPVADMQNYLDSFMPLVKNDALVVGLTHAENDPNNIQQRLSDQLKALNVRATVTAVDARDREQMRRMLHSLMRSIISRKDEA